MQNDELTMKIATKTDIWFHAQKIHGAHVIIRTGNKTPPKKTMEQAAMIAVYNSKYRNSNKVPVDYTLVSNVKKPPGAKPGMVIYKNFSTIITNSDLDIVKKIIKDD